MLTIELNQDSFFPGQMLRGECHWSAPPETRSCPAKLSLGWRTEGRGDVDHDWYTQTMTLVPQMAVPFEWEIPAKAPLSYDGELIRILWEVVVISQRDSRLPKAFTARMEAILANHDPKHVAIKPFRVVSELAFTHGQE
ncbi:MAG: hypothetical protein VKJ27_11945 [Synechocystis sp.]|nr:hypothetical protein [Synechocystis sp.]